MPAKLKIQPDFASREQVRRLIAQGVLQHAPDGRRFNVDVCRIAYIRHLRAKPTAANKLIDAKVKLAELRALRLRESMFDVEAGLAYMAEVVGSLLSGLAGIPAEFTRDLAERRRLDAIIVRHRNEFCATIEKRIAELKKKDAA